MPNLFDHPANQHFAPRVQTIGCSIVDLDPKGMSPDSLTSEERDVADRLPPRAREHLHGLRERLEIARAASSETNSKRHEARERHGKLRSSFEIFMKPAIEKNEREGRPKPVSAAQAERELARAAADYENISKRSEALSEARSRLSRLVRGIETFIGELPPDVRVFDHEVEFPKVKNGDFATAVETRRRHLRVLEANRHRVTSAPRPSKVAKELIVAEIDRLAERGAPVVDGAIEVNRSLIDWPTRLHTVEFDPLALTAWLHRDALVKKLLSEVDAIADDANALTDEQRNAALAENEGDRLATEFEEELLIRHIEAGGGSFERRPDASPQAVLQITIETGAIG
ncbi:hypothetical protein [Rhodoplanes azumiensis]|uniref:Uncharacterized protein n=1 Tax=Rhodoplanes azumiensis TaxID=1897628 RepID=A0ABW5AMD5_9BRAD